MITSVFVTRVSFWGSLVQLTLLSGAYKQKDLVCPETSTYDLLPKTGASNQITVFQIAAGRQKTSSFFKSKSLHG